MKARVVVVAVLLAALASSDGMPLHALSVTPGGTEPVDLGAANEKVLKRPLEDKACGAFWHAVADTCEAGTHISYGRAPLSAAKLVKKIETAMKSVLSDPGPAKP